MANLPRSLTIHFGHCRSGAGAAEEIGYQITFVGRSFDDAFQEGFGFLGGVIDSLGGSVADSSDIRPVCRDPPSFFVFEKDFVSI